MPGRPGRNDSARDRSGRKRVIADFGNNLEFDQVLGYSRRATEARWAVPLGWAHRRGNDPGSGTLERSPAGPCRMQALMTSPTEPKDPEVSATGVEPATASPPSSEPV